MPQESQLAHRNFPNPCLPYISNQSPTDTTPAYISGSQDILTSIQGYAARRPGFANAVEGTSTAFNNLQRLFTWDRFDGTFIEMACDINSSGFAQVYKLIVGADASFVSIFTDTSATPFDFVVSNNTVYFSNGNVAKKWDPVNGISNWGISVGNTSSNSTQKTAGSGKSNGSQTQPWTNPGDVTGISGFATVSVGSHGPVTCQSLVSYNFSFSGLSGTIAGIAVTLNSSSSGANGSNWSVGLTKDGANISGTQKTGISGSGALFGSSSDLWGTTWQATDINSNSNFGVLILPGFTSNGTLNIQNVQITVYTNNAPSLNTSSSGTANVTTGWQYVICFGNSNTGALSSPTPASASTGALTNKEVVVSWAANSDTQVTHAHIFRSTDSVASGTTAGIYFEIPGSPVSNSTTSITDQAADTSLQVNSIAPSPGFNDPPNGGAGFRGAVYFAGRIWGFAGNKVFFSSLEECIQGVPEESFVSGVAGNFWTFDEPVQGLGVAGIGSNQSLMIYCGGRIYQITGNTLDTFRRTTVSVKRGARNLTCVQSLGGMVAWLDSANQVWTTDGNTMQEISIPIRPDLIGITQSSCNLCFHTAGNFNWLILSTGSKLFVFDLDTEQWLPPWSFACNYLFSGETSPGSYQLMAAKPTIAVKLDGTLAHHNDNGTTYQPIANLALMPVVPDYGRRFATASMGVYDMPSLTGYPAILQIDTNNVSLSDVLYQVDDDPTQATYASVFGNIQSPAVVSRRNQGINIVQNIFPMTGLNPSASRWFGLQFKGKNADDNLKVFGWFLAYKEMMTGQ